ncbi:Tn3 family transposase [Streptomyces sp. CB01580]|uniref:Tn3 family transposase n=1 Tax=Streptomyces sp. CB01580 TaxID=1703933 RepID=UPI00093C73D0|nr:hypothetical protein AMK22_17285 [Streptomyces sp. CB01580]
MPPPPLRREGKVTRRRPEQQNEQAWCLTVVTNAVICWHTTHMVPAVDELRRAGREVDAEEPAHVSPARSSAVTHPHHRRPTGLLDLTMRAVNSGTTTTMNGHLSLREHRSGSSRPECSERPITLSRKLQDPRRSPSGPLTP